MIPRVPEKKKTPGVHYAVTDDGLELPIIDVTHAAFAGRPTEAELAVLLEQSARSTEQFRRMPAPLRWLVAQLFFKRGVLTRAVMAAQGSYLTGIATYLMKLGPENLGSGYAKKLDRVVAATLPAVATRLRLQDSARLLADGLAPALQASAGRPLAFVNIAGGPAADSLNALLLLRRDHPEWLEGRAIVIHVLDPDPHGAAFGGRALDALRAPGAPLHGLDARFESVSYDWRDIGPLRETVDAATSAGAVLACSSEGGLFEYAVDDDVAANLSTIRERGPEDALVVGSVTRADGTAGAINGSGGAALQLRGLDAFTRLVQRAGWNLASVVDTPLSHLVLLRNAPRGEA